MTQYTCYHGTGNSSLIMLWLSLVIKGDSERLVENHSQWKEYQREYLFSNRGDERLIWSSLRVEKSRMLRFLEL